MPSHETLNKAGLNWTRTRESGNMPKNPHPAGSTGTGFQKRILGPCVPTHFEAAK